MSEETSMSDDIAAAFDAHEKEETVDAVPEPPELEPEPAAAATEPEPLPDPNAVDGKTGDGSSPEPAVAQPEGQPSESDDDLKPPHSLPPSAREVWKDTPQAMREAVETREKQVSAKIQEYAENARRAQQMDQTLAPYNQLFAVDGGNPGQTINGLLQTASALQFGSPLQKAQVAAQIIGQFGVDIQTLDNVLSGNSTEEPQQPQVSPQQINELVDQRVNQYQATQQQTQADTEVSRFAEDPKNEFYNDVAEEMAYILDSAGRSGREMTLAHAYELACQMRPDIKAIMDARASAPTPQQRAAASSISGSPSGPSAKPPSSGSLRDDLIEAMNAVANR